ncbi:beta-lactamase/transpeptidase-like protein [Lasiosphaeria ovina]|uniref:Beta-lactamase/transpeptidase-like protein n=1 Tax=Lasiosphaeria ovina TaxID=92902 RepID=A0AAE0NA28_9PEZI|nr:beta-lactamase/transpeptidase-like protein [Lasiosphaeria ovina]
MLISHAAAADQLAYQPCPLLRAYYPVPTLDPVSDAIKYFADNLTETLDTLVRTGTHPIYGPITPNTTSFSVVLFSGADNTAADPILFSYQYTAPAAPPGDAVTLDAVFPLGTLTQLFTVYTWLAAVGDRHWDDPITDFLPELLASGESVSPAGLGLGLAVPWADVTIAALASHMAGIVQDSNACTLGKPCDRKTFINAMAQIPPLFLPDTTPVFSNAAFQLLAAALETAQRRPFADVLARAVLQPLNMARTALLGQRAHSNTSAVFGEGLDASAMGEQAALSLFSTPRDLATAGHAILSSRLIPPGTTRRWLRASAGDTSNLRNGVGRPWEVYRAGVGGSAIAPFVADIFLKAGTVGAYSSYVGLSPDVGAGFALVAHNAGGVAADLNVYADVVAGELGGLFALAAAQAGAQFAGVYSSPSSSSSSSSSASSPGSGNGSDVAEFALARDGPGLLVARLQLGGRDVRADVAAAAGIALENLDWRAYPAGGSADGTRHRFVAVVQDRSALVDAGTPTCVTWMAAGDEGGLAGAHRFVFLLDGQGRAGGVSVPGRNVQLGR